jgi:signal transduction histidine kinase
MTSRLVGLMSLVLLLSLAAFAYLMNSYQAGVMHEVNRTVSAVGKATLQTFEFHREDAPGKEGAAPAPGSTGELKEHTIAVLTVSPAAEPKSPDGTAKPSAGRAEAKPPSGIMKRVIRVQAHETGAPAGGTISSSVNEVVLVRIEDVRAESDPARGTVLKIPTWRVEDKGAPEPGGATGPMEWIHVGEPLDGETGPAAGQDIVLPIPTQDFQSLFAAYRRRSLYLFLGIFVFGTLLSAGLAARFTRPVRRLDAGIRRLTDGDLNVQVEARGRDEIGRLARGFNEMTRRLRAGREREQNLRRREKLSALGRLAAGVAHDVRNPLHSIGLTLQNLEEAARPGEADRAQEFDHSVGIIRDEIRRLDRLVENFLRFARSDRTARVSVDLSLLARETAQLVDKEGQRRGVRVEVVEEGGAGIVEGNMESIRSSVLNLVLNSFEAMPEGGTLTLKAGGSAGEVTLEVADTGRGIPAEDQEKVFEFAYTTREDGHGMGLAMVHQVVVEDHGGRVSLRSRPGEGTRVLLAFPAAAPSGREDTES